MKWAGIIPASTCHCWFDIKASKSNSVKAAFLIERFSIQYITIVSIRSQQNQKYILPYKPHTA